MNPVLFIGFWHFIFKDVFGEGYGFWKTILSLFMHLIPTAIIILLLAVSWRWEWVGGILFIGLGGFYIASNLKHPDWCLAIGTPPILTRAFFLLNWYYRAEIHSKP